MIRAGICSLLFLLSLLPGCGSDAETILYSPRNVRVQMQWHQGKTPNFAKIRKLHIVVRSYADAAGTTATGLFGEKTDILRDGYKPEVISGLPVLDKLDPNDPTAKLRYFRAELTLLTNDDVPCYEGFTAIFPVAPIKEEEQAAAQAIPLLFSPTQDFTDFACG